MGDMMGRMRDLGRLFWRGAQKTGESAAEMIEQRAHIQRLAGQVRKLDREREALVRQIGIKVYGLHGQGKIRNQDVLVDCQRIDTIMGEIGKVKHEIELIRAASLESGIEIPPLADEAPLTEDDTTAPVAARPTAVITPSGTVGQQDLPAGGVGKASEGRAEFDESGAELTTQTEGPSVRGGVHDHPGGQTPPEGPSAFTEPVEGDVGYQKPEVKGACDGCPDATVDEEPNPYDK